MNTLEIDHVLKTHPSVNVECHKIDLVVFEIERIFPNSAVQCIAVYTGNDESLWQPSQKHIVLEFKKKAPLYADTTVYFI
jgi:hypothetical protein